MDYEDEFVMGLSDDNLEAAWQICERYFAQTIYDSESHEQWIAKTFILIKSLASARSLPLPNEWTAASLTPERKFELIKQLSKVAQDYLTDRRNAEDEERFTALLGGTFAYGLSGADIQRLTTLLDELGELLETSKIDPKVRTRLISRLTKVRDQIRPKMTDVSGLYGLIGDVGIVRASLGPESNPYVDKVREIVEIAWRAQAAAQGLPTSTKLSLSYLSEETPK
ncbi:hypothetical protein [Roseiterribacter gracilis]